MLVGLVNTILVAVLGCIAATVIGVLVGVLRLSKNWLVSQLMTVYVEMFRNVPVLLWILVTFAVFTEITPAAARLQGDDEMIAAGEEPAASMILFDFVAITNRGTFIPKAVYSRSLGDVHIGFLPISLNTLAVLGGDHRRHLRLSAASDGARRRSRRRPASGRRPGGRGCSRSSGRSSSS